GHVSASSNTDAIDHAPEFFEIQSADKPALVLIHTNRENRGGKQVVVDREPRHEYVADFDAICVGHRDGRLPQATRYRCVSPIINERQFSEFGKFEYVVLKDSILLPCS